MAAMCAAESCERRVIARGLCTLHYQRWQRGADLPAERSRAAYEDDACTVVGCSKPRRGRGYCTMHYTRLMRYGDPGPAEAQRVRAYRGESCADSACAEPARRGGFCRRHYRYFKMQSDPEGWNYSTRWCMTAKQIASRDGSDCHLCGEAVDFGITMPDLMCPSVDHVIPRTLGGQDVPENVALAHLLCNLRKGARAEHASTTNSKEQA